MKISKEHRDALNEALDETAGYEGDVYVFDVKHIEILRSAVIAMLEDDDQIATVAPAVDAQPVAWMIDWPEEPDLGHYFAEDPVDPLYGRSVPLYASAQSEGRREALEEAAKVCDQMVSVSAISYETGSACAAAIRALSQKDPQ